MSEEVIIQMCNKIFPFIDSMSKVYVLSVFPSTPSANGPSTLQEVNLSRPRNQDHKHCVCDPSSVRTRI